jgi:hypothetical protein
MKNYKTYTPDEVLAALKELDSQYLNDGVRTILYGVPQLVERLKEAELRPSVDADGVVRQLIIDRFPPS